MPQDPQHVEDGFAASPCQWPSVVQLYSETGDRCTGTYVGGRLILTAAHCVPPGFSVPLNEPCEDDAQCPTSHAYGDTIPLVCETPGAFRCRSTDETFSNKIVYAQFGEEAAGYLDDLPIRRAIPLQYCRRHPTYEDGIGNHPDDIAYCLLTAEPNLQPVHVMMHCEADQFLSQGTSVTFVGFGNEDGAVGETTGGVKRWTSGTLAQSLSSLSDAFSGPSDWMTLGGTDPDALNPGDSGGPLMAKLPDGSWRLVGIASTPYYFVTPWSHLSWILGDANVAQGASRILPCHTESGAWEPKAECTDFVEQPDVAEGSWARGRYACEHTDILASPATCGSPYGRLTRAREREAVIAEPGSSAEDAFAATENAAGCRTHGTAPKPTFFLLMVAGFLRRRSR